MTLGEPSWQRNKTLMRHVIHKSKTNTIPQELKKRRQLEMREAISVRPSHLTALNELWCDPATHTFVRWAARDRAELTTSQGLARKPAQHHGHPGVSHCNYIFFLTSFFFIRNGCDFTSIAQNLTTCNQRCSQVLFFLQVQVKSQVCKKLKSQVSSCCTEPSIICCYWVS